MKRTLVFPIAVLLLTLLLSLSVFAANSAVCINDESIITTDEGRVWFLSDGDGNTRKHLRPGTQVTVSSDSEIGGLYLEFCESPGEWELETEDGVRICGESGFLHEYVSGLSSHRLTLRFSAEGQLCDLYVLSPGERPDWVQDWLPPWDRADLLLLPAHSDDDQLFFAGVIPWCLEQGARVQVAYLVSHLDDADRRNELLDGLWESGVRNYPVLGEFPDLGHSVPDHIDLYRLFGYPYELFEERQAELYRRFKPQVVITHSETGEYGHGAHVFCATIAKRTAEIGSSPEKYPDSAEEYGLWTPCKIYLHNYPYNQIRLNLDQVLPSRGMSAFEISKAAFAKHPSQFYSFNWWISSGRTAASIPLYNPEEYGLFFTRVGPDERTDTIFDNIVLYNDQDLRAREEEEIRLAAEKAERERLQREAEAQRLREEEEARREELRQEELRQMAHERRVIIGAILCLALFDVVFILYLVKRRREEQSEP